MKSPFNIKRIYAGLPGLLSTCLTLLLLLPCAQVSLAGDTQVQQEDQLSKPEKIKGIYLSGWTAGSRNKLGDLLELIDKTELNAVVIDVKDAKGKLTYRSQLPLAKEISAGSNVIRDISGLLKDLKERNIYPIARLVCFKDPLLSQARPELALKSSDGSLWKDSSGTTWLDPYNQRGWEYLVELSKEAVSLGFEEIQYDYVRFPVDGDLNDLHFGEEAKGSSKAEAIADFLAYAKVELAPSGAVVSASLLGIVLSNAKDGAFIGQDFVKIAGHVDYISPMVYPSHYANVAQNGSGQLINDVLFRYPDLEPYSVVYNVLSPAQKRLQGSKTPGRIRPWLQAFTASYLGKDRYQVYSGKEIEAQIKAVYDAGIDEWILWNSKNSYSADGLVREGSSQIEIIVEVEVEPKEELLVEIEAGEEEEII
jgi:hypothetical protein